MSMALGPREHRMRPVRALEIAAVICLVALILWVYVAKASGADESAAIRRARIDIAQEQRALRLLRAEAATLESPVRLDILVREHTDMTPVDPSREARPEAVDGLNGAPAALAETAAPATAPTPVPASPVAETPR